MNARHNVFTLTALAAMLAGATASGDERTSAPSDAAVPFSALPSGTMPRPPKTKRPYGVDGSLRVPGFAVASAPAGYGGGFAVVGPNMQAAREMGRSEFSPQGRACFTNLGGLDREDDPTWNGPLESTLTIQSESGPVPVHSERIAESNGQTSLEVADAWVDPRTHGARLIGRATIPLARVATLVGGVNVYAARDDNFVHVVLISPRDTMAREPLFAVTHGEIAMSQCDHLRVTLKVDKGHGDTTSFVDTVRLTSLDAPEPAPPPKPKAKNGPKDAPAALFDVLKTPEARFRPLHVHASASWLSRDKEPILAVSAGWDAREQSNGF